MGSLLVFFQIRVANVFQEPAPVATKLPYRGKPSFASMVAMATRAAAEAENREKESGAAAASTGATAAAAGGGGGGGGGGGATASAAGAAGPGGNHTATTPTAKTLPASKSLDGRETNL